MSATNSTTTYHLPIFLGTDVPSWLTDWNSAMSDIDIAIAAAKTTADAAQLTASNAQNAATTNAGAISTLQTTVSGQGNSITTLTGSVNTINSLIGNGLPTTTDQTIIGAINELHANEGDLLNLTTTDKSSLVAAINEVAGGGGGSVAASAVSYDNTVSGLSATDVQDAIDELASSSSGDIRYDSGTGYIQLKDGQGWFNWVKAARALFDAIADPTVIKTIGYQNTYDAPTVSGGLNNVTIACNGTNGLGWAYIDAQPNAYDLTITGTYTMNTAHANGIEIATYDSLSGGIETGKTRIDSYSSASNPVAVTYTVPANKILGINMDGVNTNGCNLVLTVFKGV